MKRRSLIVLAVAMNILGVWMLVTGCRPPQPPTQLLSGESVIGSASVKGADEKLYHLKTPAEKTEPGRPGRPAIYTRDGDDREFIRLLGPEGVEPMFAPLAR